MSFLIAISPNEGQSCLVMRHRRALQGDPLLRTGCADDARAATMERHASRDWPSLLENVDLELPDFDFRLCEVANDPLAAVLGFRAAVNEILRRQPGLRPRGERGVAGRGRRRPRRLCAGEFGPSLHPMGAFSGSA